MWRIRPGAVISAAGYAMQPTMRSGANRVRDPAAGVERFEAGPVERAAVALEVPPWDPVLGRQHQGSRAEQRGKLAGDRSDLMRLDP